MLTYIKARLDLAKAEDGSNATEYVLILALIAAVIIGAVVILGDFLSGAFTDTCDAVSADAALSTADCA